MGWKTQTMALGLACWLGAAAATAAALQVAPRTMAAPAKGDAVASWASTEWAQGSVKLPWVTGPDPVVAQRINHALFVQLLEVFAPSQPGRSFTVPAGAEPAGTASLGYTLLRNDGRVLSFAVDGEGCGAYCETYTRYLQFDARSGRALAPQDLLTPAGGAELQRQMLAERARQYRKAVRSLKQQRAQARGRLADDDDTDDRIGLNETCLAELGKAPAAEADAPLGYLRMGLAANGQMLLTAERCSNHASRGLDDVGDVTLKRSPAALAPHLTPYGRALLLRQGDAPAPESPLGQVLHGQVAGAPVTLWLNRPDADGQVNGHCQYDKLRRPLRLSGQLAGNTLTLEEQAGDQTTGRFTLEVGGSTLTGQWQATGASTPARPVALRW